MFRNVFSELPLFNLLMEFFNLSDINDMDGSPRLGWGKGGFQREQWWNSLAWEQIEAHISNLIDLRQAWGIFGGEDGQLDTKFGLQLI